ncbi:hypothetical protein J7K25_06785 [bacterium]|nr:hypothetical protein [bacterium]
MRINFLYLFPCLPFKNTIGIEATEGDELADIGLYRLDWYRVVIYAYPHFGIFEIKRIAEWFGYKEKGQRTAISNFLTLYK